MTPKEQSLYNILSNLKLFPALTRFPNLNWNELKYQSNSIEIIEVFELLGGKTNIPQWQMTKPVFYFENLIICLDDEISFNRYRKITLQSDIYKHSKVKFNVSNYLRYCRTKEAECLKAARSNNVWNDKILESVFGESDPPGQLYDRGSNVWKQRAFNDFMIDCLPIFYKNFVIMRISVWDEILIHGKITPINNFILQPNINEQNALKRLIEKNLEIKNKENLFNFKS